MVVVQAQEEKIKIREPPRVKKSIKTEVPASFLKKGALRIKRVENVGYVPAIIYANGEEILLGPIDYVIVYGPKGARKIVSVENFEKLIRGRIVVPVSSKDFRQRVFVLAELSRLGNKIIRYYFLVRPELIKSRSAGGAV